MPMVTMASQKNKLDGSVERAAYKFLQKLQQDDTTPGLHIEPIVNVVDERARTGRVNKQWRAVLYKLTSDHGNHYVYMGTYPHDDAIDIARTHRLRMNLALGVPEFEKIMEAEPPAATPTTSQPDEILHVAQAESTRPEPSWQNRLGDRWTAEALADEAGISPRFAQSALQATTPAELNAVIDQAPEAQGLVLLELANGRDLSEVREELGLERISAGDEDTQLDEYLRKPSTVGFVYVGDNPQELKDALESKNFEGWRVFLHPEQRRYVDNDTSGAYRISGGAGTGKTVVLVHRARSLAKRNPKARVVLTTFTKVLAESLSTQLRRLDASIPQVSRIGDTGVSVLGIDQIAAQVVSNAQAAEVREATAYILGVSDNELTSRLTNIDAAFEEAVTLASPDLAHEYLHPTFLEQEYVSVVLANRVIGETGYVRANRKGRGTALNRKQRKELWKVFAQFRRAQQLENTVMFEELAMIAAVILEQRHQRGERLPTDHVLVDEGQDFHSGHWALVRALVTQGPNDLFIAEDSHQRIYGEKVPLSRFGINIVGRARRLRLNYRTTAENLAFAVGVLQSGNYTDLEDIPEHSTDYRSVRSGPAPHLVETASFDEQVEIAANFIREWITAGVAAEAIGVMVRSDDTRKNVRRRLREQGVLQPNESLETEVQIITMHSAKGMEFERAIIIGVGADEMPARWFMDGIPEAEQSDVELRERSLLYVAATRARDELVITWSGHASKYVNLEE